MTLPSNEPTNPDLDNENPGSAFEILVTCERLAAVLALDSVTQWEVTVDQSHLLQAAWPGMFQTQLSAFDAKVSLNTLKTGIGVFSAWPINFIF